MAKRTRIRPTAVKRPKAAKQSPTRKRSATVQPSTATAGTPRLARVAKGRKPRYFADPATDKLLWMTLTLMTEIDGWVGDAKAAAARSTRRAAFVERMMRAAEAELAEATGRGMPVSEREVIAAVEE